MKSFHDLVCPGHYKVTMVHHLLLVLAKGSLKHWALLIIFIVPGGLNHHPLGSARPHTSKVYFPLLTK